MNETAPGTSLLNEWQAARQALKAAEAAKHPNLLDGQHREWTWWEGDLYRHGSKAWPRDHLPEPVTELRSLPAGDFVWLETGGHAPDSGHVCLMEAVALFAGETHTDAPECVASRLRIAGVMLNDEVGDEARQRLTATIPYLIGTAEDDLGHRRAEAANDWDIHEWLPSIIEWCEGGDSPHAAELRNAASYTRDPDTVQALLTPSEALLEYDRLTVNPVIYHVINTATVADKLAGSNGEVWRSRVSWVARLYLLKWSQANLPEPPMIEQSLRADEALAPLIEQLMNQAVDLFLDVARIGKGA